ncbi:MAG: WYL domain-containing protein [Acidimicrobiia bacterium]
MSPVGGARRFDAVLGALALAEEQGAVSLDDAADAVGVSADTLHALLEPVLYLDFRLTPRGGRIGEQINESRAFLLTEDGTLVVEEDNWLRNLVTEPPERDLVLHLLTAGLAYRASTFAQRRELDRALDRLSDALGAAVHVAVDTPPALGVAREAATRRRTLRFSYVKAGLAEPSEREVEPHRVFCNWGNWYVFGPEVGGGEPKYFRVDRMTDAEVADGTFPDPPDVELPDFFDLSDHAVDVDLRVPRSALRMLDADYLIRQTTDVEQQPHLVDVSLTVYGAATLDHLLLRLPGGSSVTAPHELAQRRDALAREVLALYA